MAVIDLGALGSNSATSAGTTLAITNGTGSIIPAGTTIVIAGAWDNTATTTAPSITCSTIGGTTATAGHATAVGSGVTTTAGSGIWHQCFRATTASAIANAATIATLTSNQSAVKRCAVAEGWRGLSSTLRATVVSATSTSGSPSAATTGTALVSGDLVIGTVSVENGVIPTGDSDTTNGTWDSINGRVATSGVSAANLAVGIQDKLVNATGVQTYNPTGANDSVACVFALVPNAEVTQTVASAWTVEQPPFTYYDSPNWFDGGGAGTSRTVVATWATGDDVYVLGITGTNTRTLATPTATGLTFSVVTSEVSGPAGSDNVYVWKATAAAPGTGVTISSTTSGGPCGIAALVAHGVGPVGAVATPDVTSAKSISVAREWAGSTVLFVAADDTPGATTTNWTPAGVQQLVANNNGANFGAYAALWTDQGTIATTAYGQTGTGTWTKLGAEILASDSTQPVTATKASAWTVQEQVTSTKASARSARAAVTSTAASAWTIRTPLAAPATKASAWSVRAAVNQTKASAWNLRAQVTSTKDAAWSVRASVTATKAAAWSVRAAVTDTAASAWNVADPIIQVTQSVASAWSARAAITASKSAAWSIWAAITQTKATAWSLRAAITQTRNTAWSVRQAVTASKAAAWSTGTTVTQTKASAWSQWAQVTQSRAAAWDVDAEGLTVTQTAPTAWNLRVPVSATRDASWSLRAAVTASRAASWSQRAAVSGTRGSSWTVRTTVTPVTRQTSWSVLTPVTATQAAAWSADTRLLITALSAWDVLEQVSAEVETAWRILGSVTRPNLGLVPRPNTGGSPRPDDGHPTRPGTGTVARPFAGLVNRPQ